MLPVIADLAAFGQSIMGGDDGIARHNAHPVRIEPGAHPLACQLTGNRVTVPMHAHQARTRYPRQPLDIAVKWGRHGHHLSAFQIQHLCHAEGLVFRMAQFTPQRPATLPKPRIELGKRAKAPTLRLQPNAPTTVLDVLLHHALFPAGGHVAEVSIKQIVRTHHRKARIHHTTLALVDLINGRLHVVVDPAPGNATERDKGTRVGIEQHFVALTRIGHQPEGTTRA